MKRYNFFSPTARPWWATALSALAQVLMLVLLYQSAHTASTHGIFIAANAFATVDWLMMKSLDTLMNKLAIANHFNTTDNDEFEKEFAPGPTIRKKFPQRFLITDGLGYNPQGINRITTTVSVNQIFGIHFEWDSYEKAVSMERGEEYLEREYINPAMEQLAQEIESRCAKFAYQNTSQIAGILGTDPTSFDAVSGAARVALTNLACPAGKDRGMFVNPQVMRALKASSISYFNPVQDLSKQWRTGIVGSGDGFDWYESVSLYKHTAGTWTTPTVNGAGQSGTTLTVNLTAGDSIKNGDKFGIGSVNPVNPQTRRVVGTSTKTFTITQDLIAAGGGTDVINFLPAIFGPGSQYQNVDALPGAGATITLFPGTVTPNGLTGTVNLALHPDAFALVGLPLEVPKAAEIGKSMPDPDTGISIALVRMFDPILRRMVNRFDTLIGFGNYYQDNCSVAILSA